MFRYKTKSTLFCFFPPNLHICFILSLFHVGIIDFIVGRCRNLLALLMTSQQNSGSHWLLPSHSPLQGTRLLCEISLNYSPLTCLICTLLYFFVPTPLRFGARSGCNKIKLSGLLPAESPEGSLWSFRPGRPHRLFFRQHPTAIR